METNTIYPNAFQANVMKTLELNTKGQKCYSVEVAGRNQDGELLVDRFNEDGKHVRRYIVGPRGKIETL